MAENFSLKDKLFSSTKVHTIATELKAVYAAFDKESFEYQTLQKFPELELKERIYHIRDMLKKYLPYDYKDATIILLNALPRALNIAHKDNDFGDFIYAPYSEFVAEYGCSETYLDFSLHALREITKRFSVEFAIRDFINTFPNETLEMLEICSLSDNYHERRLASESLRPKLPWGKKLTLDYQRPLQHLNNLFYDDTRYVTRSVANHLNDIAKIDAPLVLETLKRWKASGKQNPKEMDYIIDHALRTLLKQGNKDALAFLGYVKDPDIKVNKFVLTSTHVIIGEALIFNITLEAKEDTKIIIDYIIHFKTRAGTFSPKVYKLKKLTLKKGECVTVQKKHPFKANMTTRKLYAGRHKVELQINGMIYEKDTFTLGG